MPHDNLHKVSLRPSDKDIMVSINDSEESTVPTRQVELYYDMQLCTDHIIECGIYYDDESWLFYFDVRPKHVDNNVMADLYDMRYRCFIPNKTTIKLHNNADLQFVDKQCLLIVHTSKGQETHIVGSVAFRSTSRFGGNAVYAVVTAGYDIEYRTQSSHIGFEPDLSSHPDIYDAYVKAGDAGTGGVHIADIKVDMDSLVAAVPTDPHNDSPILKRHIVKLPVDKVIEFYVSDRHA